MSQHFFKFSIIFLLFTIACISIRQRTHEEVRLSDPSDSPSFAILPFEEPENNPYTLDRMREALINAFMEKGYSIQIDAAIWDSLQNELDFRIYNLNEDQASEVAQYLKVDILIFGNADFKSGISSTRPSGIYRQKVIDRPIVIKAFDASSQKILLRERIRIREDWGLDHSEKNLRDIAIEFVNKLKSMGYIP